LILGKLIILLGVFLSLPAAPNGSAGWLQQAGRGVQGTGGAT
jgi:hypothetical protein